MKCQGKTVPGGSPESHPVRGAWVEIAKNAYFAELYEMSHPVRGAWVEIGRAVLPRKENG